MRSATCRCRRTSSATIAPADRDRYQTVFAQARGSIAAPTAGLHFTPPLTAALARARRRDRRDHAARRLRHLPADPRRSRRGSSARAERYEIAPAAAAADQRARSPTAAASSRSGRRRRGRSKRWREPNDGAIVAGAGETDLFLYPGAEFRVVSGLLTNFHLPQSSLLMLVSAFAGRDRVRSAYDAAIAERYRFYSYGDAMLII